MEFYKDMWTTSIETTNKIQKEELAYVDPLTFDELEKVIISFKNKKSPGTDNINIELFKYAPQEIKYRFLNILNICWTTLQIPKSWKEAHICPIFKKGDRNDCNNYRGISLLNVAYKIFAKIITRRINVLSEVLISETQHGFRKGRSCSDCVFILKQIIQKRREYNLQTHILFIDYTKAFDKVLRNKVWDIMRKNGYPSHLVNIIEELYRNTEICIKPNGEKEETNLGMRQGCPLSPTLFNIYIDAAVEEWQKQLRNNFKIGNTILDTILFADDQVILSTSEDELQRAIYKLQETVKHYNL